MKRWLVILGVILGVGVACQSGLDEGETNGDRAVELTPTPTIVLPALTNTPAEDEGEEGMIPSENEMAFVEAVVGEVKEVGIMPDWANLEVVPLIAGQPTPVFEEHEGLVLQMQVFGFPDPKGTEALVPDLVRVTLEVAERYDVALEGIEVIFHRRSEVNPMIMFGVTPPWTPDQIFMAPVTDD